MIGFLLIIDMLGYIFGFIFFFDECNGYLFVGDLF